MIVYPYVKLAFVENNPFADELPLRWSTSPCDFRRVTPHLRLHADAQELFQDLWSALLPLRQAHDLGETSQPNGEVLWGFYHNQQVAFFLLFFLNMLKQQKLGDFVGDFVGILSRISNGSFTSQTPLQAQITGG